MIMFSFLNQDHFNIVKITRERGKKERSQFEALTVSKAVLSTLLYKA